MLSLPGRDVRALLRLGLASAVMRNEVLDVVQQLNARPDVDDAQPTFLLKPQLRHQGQDR